MLRPGGNQRVPSPQTCVQRSRAAMTRWSDAEPEKWALRG